MDVTRSLGHMDVPSNEQGIFVTFDPSKVRQRIPLIPTFSQRVMELSIKF